MDIIYIILIVMATCVAIGALRAAYIVLSDSIVLDSISSFMVFSHVAISICMLILIGGIMQFDDVDEFHEHVDQIIHDMDYNVSSSDFLDGIYIDCGKIDDADIYGMIKYDERDCVRRVFAQTEDRYKFLNGGTP